MGFVLLLMTAACPASQEAGDRTRHVTDAEVGDVATADAGTAECETSSDCVLINKGCCARCIPDRAAVRAVPAADRELEVKLECPGGAACAVCATPFYQPRAPKLRAACEAGRCEVVDLREQAVSRCDADAECKLVETGCCGSCGGDPRVWLALSNAQTDPLAPACMPIPPCAPCMDARMPEVYCAADNRCAVRAVATVAGEPSDSCFSPSQNLDRVFTGAEGCDCSEPNSLGCPADSNPLEVTLRCVESTWTVAEGVPCPK